MKVRCLAEKIGLVGGDEIDRVKELFLAAFFAENKIHKLLVGTHAEAPHLFIKVALQHGSFCRRQLDAIGLRDVLAQARETFFIHSENSIGGSLHENRWGLEGLARSFDHKRAIGKILKNAIRCSRHFRSAKKTFQRGMVF
jgi:hypothetical protein